MEQPKSKSIITGRLQNERQQLEQELDGLGPQEMTLPGVVEEWSVKDVLAHLADWEDHMSVWLEAARRGEPVAEIEPGLTWKQFDEFNQRIYERHRHQSLEEVFDYFHQAHQHFMEMVAAMPEDEMMARRRYKFIGTGAIYNWLGSYANHDRWAKTKIRSWKKKGKQLAS